MKKLTATKGMPHEEWLRYRKLGLGGSDAGAVCGLNPYRTAMEVYLDKTSESVEDVDNEAMRQGREFEEYVARRFTEATGKKVRRANFMYYDEGNPFMLADIDRMVVGENAGLECKTASPYLADKWKDGKIPISYQMQCYHYMSVCNADAWYIAVVIYGREFKYYRIERDEEALLDLQRMEQNFWENHVLKRILPKPDGSELAELEFSDGRRVEYGSEELEMVEHAYATTVHKSQGSEYPMVILPWLPMFYKMLRRNIFYTAITRAGVQVAIIGSKRAVCTAIHNTECDRRNTRLGERVIREYNRVLEEKAKQPENDGYRQEAINS